MRACDSCLLTTVPRIYADPLVFPYPYLKMPPKTFPLCPLVVAFSFPCVKLARRVISPPSLAGFASALVLLLVSAGLAGCQKTEFPQPVLEPGVSGSIFGGQQAVSGSRIQLYAVGTTGDGSTATPLITATLTTSDGTGVSNSNANAGNANNTLPAGSFTITGAYTCPSTINLQITENLFHFQIF